MIVRLHTSIASKLNVTKEENVNMIVTSIVKGLSTKEKKKEKMEPRQENRRSCHPGYRYFVVNDNRSAQKRERKRERERDEEKKNDNAEQNICERQSN